MRSLIWGARRGGGDPFELRSLLDGSVIAAGELFNEFSDLVRTELPSQLDLSKIGSQLAAAIVRLRLELISALRHETGFNESDCDEIVDGAADYARRYADHPSTQLRPRSDRFVSHGRQMSLIDVPVGTVSVILPQNAFLPLALACLFNGLRAGNRVILRAPTQSALSASLLASALEDVPEILLWVSVVLCSAAPFVEAFSDSKEPGLLHFFGSSRRAAELLSKGFDSGKSILIDGEGNGWAYVDQSFSAPRAAEILVDGALRYNGQTCTSINGAIVHPDCFDEVTEIVIEKIRALGSSRFPVFNERQAVWCQERIAECGASRTVGGRSDGVFVEPSVVLNPRLDSDFVHEGIFGPALWIAPGDADDFTSLWSTNRYPLCAAILEEPVRVEYWASRLPNLARLVMNGDPSIEDPFEYWGGYPPAGQNRVSAWPDKYRRTVQIDIPTES